VLAACARARYSGGMSRAALSHLATPGAVLRLRVTPRAGRTSVDLQEDGSLKVRVTAPPEDGKANRAVTEALARALGIAKSRLTLVSGVTSRDKAFRVED
jgi:uncharacterized protein (TIGR00251 family)